MKLYRPTLILLACAIGTNARIGTPFPSTAPTSEVNFKFIHDGHCASGWMGDNRQVETVDECATLCREREGCGYFAYDDSMTSPTNCATYLESGGCMDDERFTEYKAYEIITPPTPDPSTAPTSDPSTAPTFDQVPSNSDFFLFMHQGHCASGWMGDNRQVETVDECATLCREREGCGYFAYDDSMTFSTNCATYLESGGCLDDELFLEYKAYEIVAPSTPPTPDPSTAPTTSASSEDEESDKFSFSFFHNGHCASGWMGENRIVETIDECATICGEREGCGYFAYDASMSYGTNCATYFARGCPDDELMIVGNTYKIIGEEGKNNIV